MQPTMNDSYKDYDSQPMSKAKNMYQLLQAAATTRSGITTYSPGNLSSGIYTSYTELLQVAEANACLIQAIHEITPDSVVLLHFDNQLDSITWFWAVITAGYLPAISTPLSNHLDQRRKHIRNLQTVLHDPIILTPERLLSEFSGIRDLLVHSIESLTLRNRRFAGFLEATNKGDEETAVLMLTSGSTGLSKAVCIRHQQILSSVNGKIRAHGLKKDDVFLNWIGFDHVANLVESHIHAMRLGANQVHVHASDMIEDSFSFLCLLEKHRVSYTFAPNFFLALLSKRVVELESNSKNYIQLDLSNLRTVFTGGEANVVETCATLTQQLQRFHVTGEVIKPGYGLTETCAGSIFARACPSYDLARGNRFASIGSCIQGLEMRIVNDQSIRTAAYESGHLHLRGPIVFEKYYNNETATRAAFTDDGWFITGDRAFLDSSNNLNLVGRTKDTVIINGVHHSLVEVEASIEQIAGVAPSYTAAFPLWPLGSHTEQLCIVYSPAYDQEHSEARLETADAITRVSGMLTGTKPYQIVPLPKLLIEKSSLGKISRAKIRELFENGSFERYAIEDQRSIQIHKAATCRKPSNDVERSVLAELSEVLGFPEDQVGVDENIFDLGMTSLYLLAFQKRIRNVSALTCGNEVPLTALLSTPTIQGIANALSSTTQGVHYNPIVPLQRQGSKTPLWLVHPASGDVLAFIALSQQVLDRPVYGLRTRGFNANESFFSTIGEIARTYFFHITQHQPEGPYAIAGYSLGSTVAFEIAKLLEEASKEVKFLGLIDSPPHIKPLIRSLESNDITLNVAYFLGMIPEDEVIPTNRSRQDLLDHIFAQTSQGRLLELDMDREKLSAVSDMTKAFGDAAKLYEPKGTIGFADVFWATPLKSVSDTRGEWMDKHLRHWDNFIRSQVAWHECEGRHAVMLDRKFVSGFSRTLRNALDERGL